MERRVNLDLLKKWLDGREKAFAELEYKSGVSRYMVELLFKGNLPKKPYRIALCETIGCSMDELFPYEDKEVAS